MDLWRPELLGLKLRLSRVSRGKHAAGAFGPSEVGTGLERVFALGGLWDGLQG